MWDWYYYSGKCLVYLSDVSDIRWINEELTEDSDDAFRNSEWFERAWTLQELLAPFDVTFFDRYWKRIGSKLNISSLLSQITGIGRMYLRSPGYLSEASVAMRMSWCSRRKTTKSEDIAYCMLGILQVNIPLLYGE